MVRGSRLGRPRRASAAGTPRLDATRRLGAARPTSSPGRSRRQHSPAAPSSPARPLDGEPGPSPIGALPAPPPANAYAPVAGYGYSYTAMPVPVRPLSGGLSGWLQGVFWAIGAFAILSGITAFGAREALETFMAPSGGFEELQSWSDADRLFGLVSSGTVLIQFALLVVIIVWSWKAYRAAESLNPGGRKWRIGWTIGAWFIPCASIILPKLVLDETEKIASAPRSGGRAIEWKAVKTSSVGWAWWVMFVVANFFVMRGNFVTVDLSPGSTADRGEISGRYLAYAFGYALSAISAACGALYVRRVSRQLSAESLHASGAGYGAFGTTGSTAASSTVMGGPSVASVPNAAVDVWATRTATAATFCEICREPLAASAFRCPRCGKRRQPTATAPSSSAAPPTPSAAPPPPEPPTPWGAPPPPVVPGSAATRFAARAGRGPNGDARLRSPAGISSRPRPASPSRRRLGGRHHHPRGGRPQAGRQRRQGRRHHHRQLPAAGAGVPRGGDVPREVVHRQHGHRRLFDRGLQRHPAEGLRRLVRPGRRHAQPVPVRVHHHRGPVHARRIVEMNRDFERTGVLPPELARQMQSRCF